jgi:3-hydroxyacyl-[acyl-carrier-protein] dehydratase
MAQLTPEIPGSDGLDINSILHILPHRYPFLFVDRVIECVPGQHIVGLKNLSRADARHAISHLIVIEALAQVSVILAFKTLALQPTGRELMFFAGIDQARFGPAIAGDRLLLRSTVSRIRKMIGWFHAQAFVDDCLVVDVAMLAAIKAHPDA